MSGREASPAVPLLLGVAALAVIGSAAAAGTVASGRPLPSWVPVQLVPAFEAVGVSLPGSPKAPAPTPTPAPPAPAPSPSPTAPLVVIDPGHGTPDPGTTAGSVTEAAANLAVALTLAQQLRAAGFRTELTRTGANRPTYDYRTAYRPGQLCLIAVHHNSPTAPGSVSGALVFRQQHRGDSAALAAAVSRECGIRVLDTWESRFDRLYIDDARAPAVLWEVASINSYRDSAAWRSSMCGPVVRAVRAWAASQG